MTPQEYEEAQRQAIRTEAYMAQLREDSRRAAYWVKCAKCGAVGNTEYLYQTGYCSETCEKI